MINNLTQQALKGETPTPKEKQAIEYFRKGMFAIMQEENSWEKLRPMTIRVYQETFSEKEASEILAFYKTPTGQDVINKMPVLNQEIMLEVQKRTANMLSKMQKLKKEFVTEIESEKK